MKLEANFQKRFSGKQIQYLDKHALYVAKKSDGYSHFRGQGYLVLKKMNYILIDSFLE